MTFEELSSKLTRSWMSGYLLALEDIQADWEKARETMTGTVLNRYLEQKLKKTLKETHLSIQALEKK